MCLAEISTATACAILRGYAACCCFAYRWALQAIDVGQAPSCHAERAASGSERPHALQVACSQVAVLHLLHANEDTHACRRLVWLRNAAYDLPGSLQQTEGQLQWGIALVRSTYAQLSTVMTAGGPLLSAVHILQDMHP